MDIWIISFAIGCVFEIRVNILLDIQNIIKYSNTSSEVDNRYPDKEISNYLYLTELKFVQ